MSFQDERGNQGVEMIHLWPDGTWCFMDELREMTHMSDDYRTIPYSEVICS